ncbi:MAG: hypothetical protein IKV48_00610 [Eggerthellaceae bacterium]|nr:hypothetical protein [Eggerthellaceae bacterium]
MSFTAQTAFEARNTNNALDSLANIAGKYYVSTTATDCDAGQLCTRDSLLDCEGFTGVKNENTWKMVAATSSADANDVIYACNTYDTKLLSDGRNNWFVGHETLGLGVPAGRYGNFTRINFDGQSVYRFGAGNVTLNTSTDTFFTIDAGKLTSTASEPTTAGKIYFTLRAKGNFVEGMQASFAYYDLVACKVVA